MAPYQIIEAPTTARSFPPVLHEAAPEGRPQDQK